MSELCPPALGAPSGTAADFGVARVTDDLQPDVTCPAVDVVVHLMASSPSYFESQYLEVGGRSLEES